MDFGRKEELNGLALMKSTEEEPSHFYFYFFFDMTKSSLVWQKSKK